MAQWKPIHGDTGSIPGLAQPVVARRCGLDLALLGALAWEPPYATGMALKRPKKKKLQSPLENFQGRSCPK